MMQYLPCHLIYDDNVNTHHVTIHYDLVNTQHVTIHYDLVNTQHVTIHDDMFSGSAGMQWETCTNKLAKRVWLKCAPRDILQAIYNIG